MGEVINVGFIGNPNCGKTTLFNAYTGANLKVANWPGVTVEKKEGMTEYEGDRFKLIDLPGIYSLTSYTMEETVSRECIMSDDVDVIVDVVDASSLERNLYLTLQLIELGKPVVLALNMMDIVEERGMEIDLHRLPEMLGIPAIPVSARKRTDLLRHCHSHAFCSSCYSGLRLSSYFIILPYRCARKIRVQSVFSAVQSSGIAFHIYAFSDLLYNGYCMKKFVV